MAWWRERLSSPRQFPPTLVISAVTAASEPDRTVEVIFRADPNIYDGRYANVGWLQEIPKPVTSMSWDNAALMSYRTLAKFGLAESGRGGHRVERQHRDGSGPGGSRSPRWRRLRCTWAMPAATGAGWPAAWASTPTRSAASNASAVCFRRDHEEDGPDLRVLRSPRATTPITARSPPAEMVRATPLARRQRGPDARHRSLRHAG